METNTYCDITPEGLVGMGMSFEDDLTLRKDIAIGTLYCVFSEDGYMYSEICLFEDARFDVPVVRMSDVEVIVRCFGR